MNYFEWDGLEKTKDSLVKSQSLTTASFASVVVTSQPIRFHKTTTTRSNGCFEKPKVESRSLYHPLFISPLVRGHVSGLPKSKSKQLDKIRKHRFFHELLTSERNEYMTALHKTRTLQRLKEKYSALKIQQCWRVHLSIIENWKQKSLKSN
mmetsp:Transcript_14821/g.19215  ORF Transcript_14821/g.19215 Transcript_14821/m.19215 type:complete len:151 (+) Transcript_14821:91-543(+)